MSEHDFSHSDGKLLDTETDGSTVRPAARGARASRGVPGAAARVQGGPSRQPWLCGGAGVQDARRRPRTLAAGLGDGTSRPAVPAARAGCVPRSRSLCASSADVAVLQIPRARRAAVQSPRPARTSQARSALCAGRDYCKCLDAAALLPDSAVCMVVPFADGCIAADCCVVVFMLRVCVRLACFVSFSRAGAAPPIPVLLCACGGLPLLAGLLCGLCRLSAPRERVLCVCFMRAVRGCPSPVGNGRVRLRRSR